MAALLLFLSGFSALVYQVLWTRELGLFFGHTVYAVSAVLTAFMGGLALGSQVSGRLIPKVRSPLQAYGWLELGIAAAGALFWLLPPLLDPIYRLLYESLSTHFYAFNLARCALAIGILLIPATLMGATLPAVSAWQSEGGRAAAAVGGLYAANTFGATAGSLAAGFLLIERLGVVETQAVAAAVNAAVGVVALIVGHRSPVLPTNPPTAGHVESNGVDRGGSRSRGSRAKILPATNVNAGADRFLLGVMALSGFTALAYEVVWTRGLVFHVGTTTHAFTSMLAVYLLGLAGGSFVSARLIDRVRHVPRALANLQLAIGACCALSLVVLDRTAPHINELIPPDASWASLLTSSVLKAAITMLVPTFLFGAMFPVALRLTPSWRPVAARVGRLYAANTWGSLAGAMAAGFILIPLLGIRQTLFFCATINVALALLSDRALHAVVAQPARESIRPALWWTVATAGVVLVAGFGALRLGTSLHRTQGSEQLVYYAEGNTATVSVIREVGGTKTLYIDKVPVAATDPIMLTDQKTLAHLPMLLHSDPRRVLTVGFGSGGASWSFARYDRLESIDCVEIDPAVFGAAPHLEESNHAVWRDPRFRLIIEDARSYLAYTKQQYDIISTDCTDLRYKTNANLYTTDYFGLCRRRLRPNGMVVVWMPLGGLDEDVFKMALRTFRTVFPHATLWYLTNYPTHYALLVGSVEPLRIDVARAIERLTEPDVRRDLAEIGLSAPAKIFASLVLNEQAYAAFVGDGPINSDRHPYLEFLAPRRAYRFALSQNLSALAARRSDIEPWLIHRSGDPDDLLPSLRRAARAAPALLSGHATYQRGTFEYASALNEYRRAAALDPSDPSIPALIDLVESTRAMWMREFDERGRKGETTVEERVRLGSLYREAGRVSEAIAVLADVVAVASTNSPARRELAAALAADGQIDRAITEYEASLTLAPDSAEAHNDVGLLYLARRDYARAEAAFASAARLDPESAAAFHNLGLVHSARGEVAGAEAAYRDALTRDRRLVEAWGNLAALLASTNRRQEAIAALEALLDIDPDVEVARRMLAELGGGSEP
jgi:spermidine synthase